MFGCDCCCISSFVYLVGLFAIGSKVIPFVVKKIKGNKPVELQEKAYKKDVVYLYQLPGTPFASSVSPYCIKVEAFCRLHEIKFERRNTLTERGANSLLPFIELNGEVHSDSQIILRRITQVFKLKDYPDERSAAIGHAVTRLIENHTSTLIAMTKSYVKVVESMAAGTIPSFLLPLVSYIGGCIISRKKLVKARIAIGTFKDNEIKELLRNDLIQLQTILGKKKFLLGDEPTAVDCSVFGQIGCAYAIPSMKFDFTDLLDSAEFSSLKEYFERVKSRIFGNEFSDKN